MTLPATSTDYCAEQTSRGWSLRFKRPPSNGCLRRTGSRCGWPASPACCASSRPACISSDCWTASCSAAPRSCARIYDDLHRRAVAEPILSYGDGGDFMIIRERRLRGDTASHRLEGSSRQIYLFCNHHRSLRRITANFPSIPADKIVSFLQMMTAQ